MIDELKNSIVARKCDHNHFLHPFCKDPSFGTGEKARIIALLILLNVITLGVPLIIYSLYKGGSHLYKVFSQKKLDNSRSTTIINQVPMSGIKTAQSRNNTASTNIKTPDVKDSNSKKTITTPNNPSTPHVNPSKDYWWTKISKTKEFEEFKKNWKNLTHTEAAREQEAQKLQSSYKSLWHGEPTNQPPYSAPLGTIYSIPGNFSMWMSGVALVAAYLAEKKKIEGLYVCETQGDCMINYLTPSNFNL